MWYLNADIFWLNFLFSLIASKMTQIELISKKNPIISRFFGWEDLCLFTLVRFIFVLGNFLWTFESTQFLLDAIYFIIIPYSKERQDNFAKLTKNILV